MDVKKVSGPGGEEEEDVRYEVQVFFKGMMGETIRGTFGSLDNVDFMRDFLCKRLDGNVLPAQLTLIFSGKHLDGLVIQGTGKMSDITGGMAAQNF